MKNIEEVKAYITVISSIISDLHQNDEFQEQMTSLRMIECEEEFKGEDTSNHVFDYFELHSMDIVGCASWAESMKNKVDDLESKIKILKSYSLFNQPKLMEWIVKNKDKYPKYVQSQLLIDYIGRITLDLFLAYQEGLSDRNAVIGE